MTAGRTGRWWLLALVAVPSLLVLFWALGLGGALSPDGLEERQAELRALAAAHPVLAPLGFTGVYVAAVALSVPGAEVLTLAGGLLFGTVLGSLCTVVGATAGATGLFLLARTALGGVLAGRAGGLLARVRPGLERDGLSYLLALRLLPAVPFWLVNLAAALVPMRLGAFVLGTAVGIVPATVVFSAAGAGLGQVLAAGGSRSSPPCCGRRWCCRWWGWRCWRCCRWRGDGSGAPPLGPRRGRPCLPRTPSTRAPRALDPAPRFAPGWRHRPLVPKAPDAGPGAARPWWMGVRGKAKPSPAGVPGAEPLVGRQCSHSTGRGAQVPDYDLAVIGAGSAGLSVTFAAARLGLRVALVERGRMGGDCLNVGCVPSKALLACAHAAGAARRASALGVRLPEPEVHWPTVRAHVRGAIARIAPNDSAERYEGLGATVLRGEARFLAPDRLSVEGRALTARRVVVASGSTAAVPGIPGLDRTPFLTNETLWELAERPEHLLILGGGAIGVEMAQAHRLLGCRVTVVEAGRLLGREDAELAALLRDHLRGEGVTVLEGAAVAAAEPTPAGPCLCLADGRRVAGSHLLVAVGRTPNLASLSLDAAGVAHGARGVRTDAGLRSTTQRRVFAAGDVADPDGIGPTYLTHAAGHHASVVVRRALFRLPARVEARAMPRVTYTDPELAQVGLTEAQARERGDGVRVTTSPLRENDRAVAEGRTEGLAKLVLDRRGRLLGAGILAPHAGEMIGQWVLALGQRASPATLAGLVLPYPTRAEAARRAVGAPLAERLFAPGTGRLVRGLARLP